MTRFDRYMIAWLGGARFERPWAARLQTLGCQVQVQMGAQLISGVAESVQADGSLSVRCADGRVVLCHGTFDLMQVLT